MLEVFDRIENANGSNERSEILKILHPKLVQAFVYAMDPSKIYYVTTRDIPSVHECTGTMIGDEDWLNILFHVLDLCTAGSLRGNQSILAVRNLFLRATPLQRKWGSRIISKHMRCGVGWGLFTSVHRGLLHGFRSQLCGTYRWTDLKGSWLSEPKIDGTRCYMVFSHDGEVEVYSRNGKPMPGGEDIAKPLSRYFAGYVLDGELAASDRFKSISKARSKSGNRDGLNYYAFDIMPITCWQQSDPTSLISRRKTLVERFMDVPEEHRHSLMLLPVNRLIDPTTEQIHQEMKTYRDHGFEGAVLKNVQSPYKFDRSGDWLKCKPVDTGDFRLVDIERGHGRLQGTCGNLVVDVDGVRVRVGTGLNDQMRNYFWFNRNELLEQNLVIEVGYEQRTPDGSLNFPRFIKIRKDKINE